MGPLNNYGHTFYPQFILTQHQEVGHKPAHTDTRKKVDNNRSILQEFLQNSSSIGLGYFSTNQWDKGVINKCI